MKNPFGKDEYVIVRTYSAGVFACYIEEMENKEALLKDARLIWYWSGAASLSQLAMEGVKNPEECKFPIPVDTNYVTEVIQVLKTTKAAEESIRAVPIWEA